MFYWFQILHIHIYLLYTYIYYIWVYITRLPFVLSIRSPISISVFRNLDLRPHTNHASSKCAKERERKKERKRKEDSFYFQGSTDSTGVIYCIELSIIRERYLMLDLR